MLKIRQKFTERLELRVSAQQKAALEALAEKYHCSVSAVVKAAIDLLIAEEERGGLNVSE